MNVCAVLKGGGGGQLDANIMGPLQRACFCVRLIPVCEPAAVPSQHTLSQFYFRLCLSTT